MPDAVRLAGYDPKSLGITAQSARKTLAEAAARSNCSPTMVAKTMGHSAMASQLAYMRCTSEGAEATNLAISRTMAGKRNNQYGDLLRSAQERNAGVDSAASDHPSPPNTGTGGTAVPANTAAPVTSVAGGHHMQPLPPAPVAAGHTVPPPCNGALMTPVAAGHTVPSHCNAAQVAAGHTMPHYTAPSVPAHTPCYPARCCSSSGAVPSPYQPPHWPGPSVAAEQPTTFKLKIGEEFRRFQIDYCSYNLLMKKLQSYHVDKVITSVSWTDEDGDEIAVKCDEDVKILLQTSSFSANRTVKLNVGVRVQTAPVSGGQLDLDMCNNNGNYIEILLNKIQLFIFARQWSSE